MEKIKKINLGCGYQEILKGYINYDKFTKAEGIKYIDLEILPLPFKNNQRTWSCFKDK